MVEMIILPLKLDTGECLSDIEMSVGRIYPVYPILLCAREICAFK